LTNTRFSIVNHRLEQLSDAEFIDLIHHEAKRRFQCAGDNPLQSCANLVQMKLDEAPSVCKYCKVTISKGTEVCYGCFMDREDMGVN
jgi:hypothetical protein